MTAAAAEEKIEAHDKKPGVRAIQSAFAAEDFRPPFLLRLGAALIDYILLLVIPLTGLLSERIVGGDGFGVFADRTLWLFAVILCGVNVVLLPLFTGQSVGKMLTGIRIVRADGGAASFRAIILRQTVGYSLSVLTLGLGFFAASVTASGRSLHDFLCGTVVVRGRKTFVSA